MKLLKHLFILLLPLGLLASCDKDDPINDPQGNSDSLSPQAKAVYNKLCNTTWRLVSSYSDKAPLGNTITFSSTPVINDLAYQLHCSYFPNDIFAWVPADNDDCDLLMTGTLTQCNASNAGAFSVCFGSRVNISITGDKMTMTSTSINNARYEYIKTSSQDPDNQGGNTEYEKPDVDFYDYTQQGSSSVKVDYIIYNADDAGVSSATIKYGTNSSTSSSASTSIIGKHAIATISGLKPNTKYYVRCTVKSKGGTITTDAIPISITSW